MSQFRLTIRQLERLADLLQAWSDVDQEAERIRREVEQEIASRRRATGHVNRRPRHDASSGGES